LDTESWILDERKAVESELRALLENEPPLVERQQEIMVDPTMIIALQSVTGVASGFAGKLLYDKWKECTTRRQLINLANRIPLAPKSTETVDEEVIRRDVVEVLKLEGLSPSQAEYLTERVVARVRSRLAKGGAPRGDR
jgi:hypothetical protein